MQSNNFLKFCVNHHDQNQNCHFENQNQNIHIKYEVNQKHSRYMQLQQVLNSESLNVISKTTQKMWKELKHKLGF